MRGEVEVFYVDSPPEKSSNMILNGFGSLLTDIFTLPSLISETTYSSILDTSNYVIQAITLGKDAEGYNKHAHANTFSAQILADSSKIIVLNNANGSSYVGASAEGSLLPEQPYPNATRLESRSTAVSAIYPSSYDYGHNANLLNGPTPVEGDELHNLVGCYAPEYSITITIVSSLANSGTPAYTTTLTGNNFNKQDLINPSGYIYRTTSSLEHGRTLIDASSYSGLMINYEDGWDSNDLKISYTLAVSADDKLMLNIFGGIYNVGLWALDIKSTLAKGLLPPYNLKTNSGLVYKLVAKKSFIKDITYMEDKSGSAGFSLLKAAVTTANPGLVLVWNLYFK